MTASWKDDPPAWEEGYRDQDTRLLTKLGFPMLSSTKIVLVEKPLELLALQEKIDKYWQEFAASKQNAFNGQLYAMSGWNDFEYDGNTLIAKAFETNFATLLLKQDARGKVTPEEQEFLDSKIMFLGSSGYVQHKDNYLVGQVARRNIKQDLWETVPQGSVSHGFHRHDDPFHKTMAKEAMEETSLDLGEDFEVVLPWGINIGPKVGNCTLIYRLQLKPSSLEKVKCSPEHLALEWRSKQEILDPANRYTLNPITPRLFEKI